MMRCLLAIVVSVLALSDAAHAQNRKACPYFPAGGPDGSGFTLWYSPFCEPDSGVVGLLLPDGSDASFCNDGANCVEGLGVKKKVPTVHKRLKDGYKTNTVATRIDETISFKPRAGLQVEPPNSWKIVFKDKTNKERYLKVNQITIPEQVVTITTPGGSTYQYRASKQTFMIGWEVAVPGTPAQKALYEPAHSAKFSSDVDRKGVAELEIRTKDNLIADLDVVMFEPE